MAMFLRLQNLPDKAGALDIRSFFHNLAIPKGGVRIIGGEFKEAFIWFENEVDLLMSLERQGQNILGQRIKLLIAKENAKTAQHQENYPQASSQIKVAGNAVPDYFRRSINPEPGTFPDVSEFFSGSMISDLSKQTKLGLQREKHFLEVSYDSPPEKRSYLGIPKVKETNFNYSDSGKDKSTDPYLNWVNPLMKKSRKETNIEVGTHLDGSSKSYQESRAEDTGQAYSQVAFDIFRDRPERDACIENGGHSMARSGYEESHGNKFPDIFRESPERTNITGTNEVRNICENQNSQSKLMSKAELIHRSSSKDAIKTSRCDIASGSYGGHKETSKDRRYQKYSKEETNCHKISKLDSYNKDRDKSNRTRGEKRELEHREINTLRRDDMNRHPNLKSKERQGYPRYKEARNYSNRKNYTKSSKGKKTYRKQRNHTSKSPGRESHSSSSSSPSSSSSYSSSSNTDSEDSYSRRYKKRPKYRHRSYYSRSYSRSPKRDKCGYIVVQNIQCTVTKLDLMKFFKGYSIDERGIKFIEDERDVTAHIAYLKLETVKEANEAEMLNGESLHFRNIKIDKITSKRYEGIRNTIDVSQKQHAANVDPTEGTNKLNINQQDLRLQLGNSIFGNLQSMHSGKTLGNPLTSISSVSYTGKCNTNINSQSSSIIASNAIGHTPVSHLIQASSRNTNKIENPLGNPPSSVSTSYKVETNVSYVNNGQTSISKSSNILNPQCSFQTSSLHTINYENPLGNPPSSHVSFEGGTNSKTNVSTHINNLQTISSEQPLGNPPTLLTPSFEGTTGKMNNSTPINNLPTISSVKALGNPPSSRSINHMPRLYTTGENVKGCDWDIKQIIEPNLEESSFLKLQDNKIDQTTTAASDTGGIASMNTDDSNESKLSDQIEPLMQRNELQQSTFQPKGPIVSVSYRPTTEPPLQMGPRPLRQLRPMIGSLEFRPRLHARRPSLLGPRPAMGPRGLMVPRGQMGPWGQMIPRRPFGPRGLMRPRGPMIPRGLQYRPSVVQGPACRPLMHTMEHRSSLFHTAPAQYAIETPRTDCKSSTAVGCEEKRAASPERNERSSPEMKPVGDEVVNKTSNEHMPQSRIKLKSIDPNPAMAEIKALPLPSMKIPKKFASKITIDPNPAMAEVKALPLPSMKIPKKCASKITTEDKTPIWYPLSSLFPVAKGTSQFYLGVSELKDSLTASKIWKMLGAVKGGSKGVVLTKVPETHEYISSMGFAVYSKMDNLQSALNALAKKDGMWMCYSSHFVTSFFKSLEDDFQVYVSTARGIDRLLTKTERAELGMICNKK